MTYYYYYYYYYYNKHRQCSIIIIIIINFVVGLVHFLFVHSYPFMLSCYHVYIWKGKGARNIKGLFAATTDQYRRFRCARQSVCSRTSCLNSALIEASQASSAVMFHIKLVDYGRTLFWLYGCWYSFAVLSIDPNPLPTRWCLSSPLDLWTFLNIL